MFSFDTFMLLMLLHALVVLYNEGYNLVLLLSDFDMSYSLVTLTYVCALAGF